MNLLFMNIKRSGRAAAAVLLAALLLTGCETQETSVSNGGSYSSDTHLPSSPNDSPGGNISDTQSGSESSEGNSESESANESDPSGYSQSSDTDSAESPGESSSGENSTLNPSAPNGESSNSGEPSSNSTSSSSTVKPPDPPVQVVIPDFEVPTSPGVKVFSAANGWVDYTNASKGYISAKYTGGRARSKLRIIVNGEPVYTYDLSVGGVVEFFPLSLGNGTYKVILFEQIQGSDYSIVLQNEFEVNMTNPRSPFSYPNRYVDYDENSKCVYKAAELCAGKTDNISKIAAVFKWVTDNISYDDELAATVPTTYYPDPDRTMQKKTGICYDYASLMAAMLRSQGIPTRLVKGYAGSTLHAWNEIYTEQTGWITPELFLANNGYNTVDATFYAGADNKKQIADYISNPSNYSVLYYY